MEWDQWEAMNTHTEVTPHTPTSRIVRSRAVSGSEGGLTRYVAYSISPSAELKVLHTSSEASPRDSRIKVAPPLPPVEDDDDDDDDDAPKLQFDFDGDV